MAQGRLLATRILPKEIIEFYVLHLKMAEWWKRAMATIITANVVGWSVHFWNKGYRQRGETHPITAWLEGFVSLEADDRQKRIEYIKRETERAERRLYAIHTWFPNLRTNSHQVDLKGPDGMTRTETLKPI